MTRHGTSVLHHVDPSEAMDALDRRIKDLQTNGHKALVVSALQPARNLIHHFEDVDGIHAAAVGIVDCTGDTASSSSDKPGDHIMFVESPALLETILVRVDRVLKTMGDGTAVLVHTLDAFMLYTSRQMVLDFANQLIHNLRPRGIDVELLCVCTEASDEIVDKMESLVDLTIEDAKKKLT